MIKIPENEKEWSNIQPMFFVATAPIAKEGHINVSPKGGDSFILQENRFIYADYTGSGIETIAHIKENQRICIMFCSFEKIPKILRFHGLGSYIIKGDPEFDEFKKLIPYHNTIRAFIKVDITRFAKSCGYGVPLFEFSSHRDTLLKWSNSKSLNLDDYQKQNNTESIDGLKGL